MYRIKKTFKFSASHQLTGLPESHPCSRLHGHNYVVIIELQSDSLDNNGFVLDFGELKKLKYHIDKKFDHQHLNKIVTFNPTSENLAKYFYDWSRQFWNQVAACRVKETEGTMAEYRP